MAVRLLHFGRLPVRALSSAATSSSRLLEGVQLHRKDGSTVAAEKALKGKTVALLFTAGWCRPCRMFTPKIRKFYEEVAGRQKQNFEVVWVSRDRSAEDQISYFKENHGDWLYIEFGSPLIPELLQHYDVPTIPAGNRALISAMRVVDPEDGSVIVQDARTEVEQKGQDDPIKLFQAWKNRSKQH